MIEKIEYIDRLSKTKREEKIYCEWALRFLYSSSFGRFIGKCLSKNPLFSKLAGWWQRRSFTKRKIPPFIKKYALDPKEFELSIDQFCSFDAFFIRKLKKEARPLASGAVLPADGRYLVYPNIEKCDGFVVKGQKFSLETLLNSQELAIKYAQGSMAIIRLAPSDYHRFHFPCTCRPTQSKLINGPLFSVNPIAIKQNIAILAENKRMITHLTETDYGEILFIEIGATNVGTIHQTYIPNQLYAKGDEKGFFSFGGSSIILIFEPKALTFADDLLHNSSQHIETLGKFGQTLEELN